MEWGSKIGYEGQKVNTWDRTVEEGSQEGEKKGQEGGSTKAVYENTIIIYGILWK